MTSSLSKPIFSTAPHAELITKRLGLVKRMILNRYHAYVPLCRIWDPPSFTTEHRFERCSEQDPTENLAVQFQRYSFNAFVFAIDPTTNHSVHIAMFGILDALGDFVIHSHDAPDTTEFTYDSGNGLVTTEVEPRVLRGEITRSAIAKAFAICLFLVNWTLTVGSVYITTLVASRILDANSVVAALPFSAPLTIPMVRSLYIDSPPMGTSIGQHCVPSLLPFRFMVLTDCLRHGSIFRANRDRRVMFSSFVRSPHESPAPAITPE